MAIGTDFEIQNDKDIRYIGAAHTVTGAGYHTVIDFHRWLQDLADDASSAGDDYLDITRDTPSDRSTDNIITLINGYNIDDTAAEHLYGGSIIQSSGAVIYDGVLVYANPGMDMQIHQDGSIIVNDFWNSIPFGGSGKGLNADSANGISHRFMLKVRTGGADTDGRRLICQTRVWGKTFSEFKINGTSRGNNVAALTYADDLNNVTAEGTVGGWTSITNAEGFRSIDVNNDTAFENYYSEWNKDTYTINQFYERIKYLQRLGSAATLYGLNGEVFRGITHEITVDTPTGTFAATGSATWSGGSGQMLAINHATAPTKMWIQLLTGVAPVNNEVITVGAATCQMDTTIVERTLSFPACGVSTGSALIGAYGFGVEKLDLSATDKVFDLTNTQRQAPNYVTFTVGNLVSGDRVLIAPLGYHLNYDTEASGPFTLGETLTFTSPAGTAKLVKLVDNGTTGEMIIAMLTGSVPVDNSTIAGATATAIVNGSVSADINLGQMNLNGALSGASVTSVVVSGAIPSDTPATGRIRILRASGFYTSHPYSAWTGSTFTITSHNFSTDNAANGANVFVAYFDDVADASSEGFTGIYSTDRSLFVRVRNGGGTPKIKTYETSAVLGSAGGSATTSRISDE